MSAESFWAEVSESSGEFWFPPDALHAFHADQELRNLHTRRERRVAKWGGMYVRIMEEHERREREMAKMTEVPVTMKVSLEDEDRVLIGVLVDALESLAFSMAPKQDHTQTMDHTVKADDIEKVVESMNRALNGAKRGTPMRGKIESLPWSEGDPGGLDATDGVLCDVGAERARQIADEGYTLDHDDGMVDDELARAGAALALPAGLPVGTEGLDDRAELWPFGNSMKGGVGRRRELVQAAALIVAEIERLDRIEAP